MPEKRVLIFCGGTRVFGAEIVTLSIMKELKGNGYELFCITSAWNNGRFHKKLEEAGIGYQPVKLGFIYLTKLNWTISALFHLPGAIYKIRKVLKDFEPDLIYYTSYQSLLIASPFLKKKKSLLFVFDPYYGKLNKFYFKLLNKLTYTYVAVSNAIKDNLLEIGASAEKIFVLKNGIDVELFTPASEPEKTVRFGVVGQITPRKGHTDIVEAFNILKSENIRFKCVIIGSGSQDFILSLKEKIRDYDLESEVIWIDFIESRDEIYQLFDIALVPSITLDPLPTVAMEAGLYYKPCIVTNMGGLPEIILDNKTGFIIKPNDPQELARKMEELISDKDMILSMGNNAHNHIIKNFDIKLQAKKLAAIIDN